MQAANRCTVRSFPPIDLSLLVPAAVDDSHQGPPPLHSLRNTLSCRPFLLFILSLVIQSLASSLPETTCSDEKSGLTVQLAHARLPPLQPTDHSLTPLHKLPEIIEKRQESGCSADAPPVCNNDSPQRPSASDCSKILDDLNSSATQFVVQGFQTITRDWNTCRFSLRNIVSSPFIYCDTSWASRSSDVISRCFSGNNGGFAQGSRFSLIVGYNPNYQAPQPSPSQPSVNPPVTQSNSGINGGTNNGGTGNNNNNNNSGATSSNGSGSQQTAGAGTNGNPSSAGGASGSTSGATRTDGSGTSSTSGVMVTSLVVSGSTTLSGGSVVAATFTLSSLSMPAFGASFPTDPSASGNGGARGNTATPYMVPAIVGSLLGTLSILFLLLFCVWRRKKREISQILAEEGQQGQQEMDEVPQTAYDVHRGLSEQQRQQNPVAGAGGSQESLASAVALAKAQMAAEDSRQGRRHGHDPSVENVSSITGDSVLSPMDSATPPYRSRSERDRRGRGAARSPSASSSNNPPHRHWRGAIGSGTITTETAPSLITSSSSRSQSGSETSRRHHDSTRRHHHSQRRRRTGDGDSMDSGSISARTLAQTAAPNLSETDIDRLAESIVARIHGRDPALTEHGRYVGHGNGARVSVLSEGEEEPPPPWSAPEAERNNRESLRGL